MKLLIDTQLIFWRLVEPSRLPAEAQRLIEDSTDSVMVSVASEWELAIKVSTKKVGLDMPTFSQGIDKAGFDRLGITPLHKRHPMRIAISGFGGR